MYCSKKMHKLKETFYLYKNSSYNLNKHNNLKQIPQNLQIKL